MVKCPACQSDQVVFLVSPQRTNCYQCGATWLQSDGQQTSVNHADSRVPDRRASQAAP
jgi:ribosomal protein S27E